MKNNFDVARKYWEYSKFWWIINFLLFFIAEKPPWGTIFFILGGIFNAICLYFAFDIVRLKRKNEAMIAYLKERLHEE